MAEVTVHSFRVGDRVLVTTEADAGDVVFLGTAGRTAYPFIVQRTISGPGGTYVDACDVLDADGTSLALVERKFELDGHSKPRTVTTEFRSVAFASPGTYTLQYSVYDDVVGNFTFKVVQQDSPSTGIVPGPLDASLAKSTIAWIRMPRQVEQVARKKRSGPPPDYMDGLTHPVWYGYQDGRVYVLVGEAEQQVPGLTEASSVTLIARSKDKRSQVAEVECGVEILPKDGAWKALARDLLMGRRLNLPDGDAAIDRWFTTCEIVTLTPLPPAIDAI